MEYRKSALAQQYGHSSAIFVFCDSNHVTTTGCGYRVYSDGDVTERLLQQVINVDEFGHALFRSEKKDDVFRTRKLGERANERVSEEDETRRGRPH